MGMLLAIYSGWQVAYNGSDDIILMSAVRLSKRLEIVYEWIFNIV